MEQNATPRALSRSDAIAVVVILFWAVVFMITRAYPGEILLGLPAMAILFVGVIALVVYASLALVRRSRSKAIVALLLLVAIPSLLFFGMSIAVRVRFALIKPQLMAEVQQLHGIIKSGGKVSQFRVEVSASQLTPPVAFSDGGIIDNWMGFVYDPTGQIDKVKNSEPIPPPVKRWFGGDMMWVMPLGDGWFYCGFS